MKVFDDIKMYGTTITIKRKMWVGVWKRPFDRQRWNYEDDIKIDLQKINNLSWYIIQWSSIQNSVRVFGFDMICLLTAIVLTPGSSSTVHI
jgi:hypothetical protein